MQMVIDLHRDAFTYADGSVFSTAETINGERCARLMFLVGSDSGPLSHPEWESHLALAMELQTELEDIAPGVTRPINLRTHRFNQHMTPGSLLLEVGASGDTLEEAVRAVRYFAAALRRVVEG